MGRDLEPMRRRRVWLALAGAVIVAAGVITAVVARRPTPAPTQEAARRRPRRPGR